jgi:hypothetical protein
VFGVFRGDLAVFEYAQHSVILNLRFQCFVKFLQNGEPPVMPSTSPAPSEIPAQQISQQVMHVSSNTAAFEIAYV